MKIRKTAFAALLALAAAAGLAAALSSPALGAESAPPNVGYRAGTALVQGDAEPGDGASTVVTQAQKKPHVSYSAYVQKSGWQSTKKDGAPAGTQGNSLRLEAFRAQLAGGPGGSIEYRAHVQGIGWQPWKRNGAVAGTQGRSLRIEALQIRLAGAISKDYDIYYRVHAQNVGWTGWARNGQSCGTAGFSYRIESVQVKLVAKGGKAPGATDNRFRTPLVKYRTHVQKEGWQSWRPEGAEAGTHGKSLRLEALQLKLAGGLKGGIRYSTHVQGIGWQPFVQNGTMAGTAGQSRRLEAVKIELTGAAADDYDVYYRVHAQNFGWMGWAKNGEPAGTAGYSYRLEALEVKLVAKGGKAPGATAGAYRTPLIRYRSYLQKQGWQGHVAEGATSGALGANLRMEGFGIMPGSIQGTGSIEYRAKVQTLGWQDWKTNDALAGTSGKSLRVEAMQIRLTGDYAARYDIYYRTHSTAFGWGGWAKNGEQAGLEGYPFLLDGYEVKLVAKGGKAPGSSEYAYRKGEYGLEAWKKALDQASGAAEITVMNGSITSADRERLEAEMRGARLGFIGLNLKTGKVISYNPDEWIYSASSVKGPHCCALCKYGASGITDYAGPMWWTCTISDNDAYATLVGRYGVGYLYDLQADADVDFPVNGAGYALYNPRILCKLWAVMADYIDNGYKIDEDNWRQFRDSFSNGFYKVGYMYPGTWYWGGYNSEGIYNGGEYTDGCIYAVQSTYYSESNKTQVWDLGEVLVDALQY